MVDRESDGTLTLGELFGLMQRNRVASDIFGVGSYLVFSYFPPLCPLEIRFRHFVLCAYTYTSFMAGYCRFL